MGKHMAQSGGSPVQGACRPNRASVSPRKVMSSPTRHSPTQQQQQPKAAASPQRRSPTHIVEEDAEDDDMLEHTSTQMAFSLTEEQHTKHMPSPQQQQPAAALCNQSPASPVRAAPVAAASAAVAAPAIADSRSTAAAPAVSTAPTAAAVPASSPLVSLATLARPVSSAAGHVFRVWYRAVSVGFRRALQLRHDWREGQSARRKVAALMRARAEERLRAKQREHEAMQRLQQLEAQIQHMQQLLDSQPAVTAAAPSLLSPFIAAPVTSSPFSAAPSSPAFTVPIAPPLSAAVSLAPPMAPPMAPSLLPDAHLRSVAPAAAASVPANRPSALSLQHAAAMLRPSSAAASAVSSVSAPAPTPAARSATSGLIDTDMLRGVKLKQAAPRPRLSSSHPSQSNSNFLMAALQSKFQRTAMPHHMQRSRVSLTSVRSLSTPLTSRRAVGGGGAAASAFSPMTPCTEADEQWTPAR